jgi:hypothetical protein
MSGRWLGITVALALAVPPLWAEGAHPRSGHESTGGGGSGSSAGARHHGGDSGGSKTYSGDSSSSGSSHRATEAQRRHPRAGTGTGRHHGRGGSYYPYYPYYRSYYGGYWPYYGYGYGYGYGWGYPGYRYRSYDLTGSLRILVDPSKTRVYVDGYYSGVADDFDGLFQRLNLPPGRHEIVFKLEGYRTHRVRLYVPADHTLKIHHDMLKGDGDETLDETLDQPSRDWADRERERYRDSDRDRTYDRDRRRDDERERDAGRDDDDSDDADSDRYASRAVPGSGGLRLNVRPDDASVYVDGKFRGTGREAAQLELPPGRHRVEVVRPGYRTFDVEVDVKADQPAELTAELQRP